MIIRKKVRTRGLLLAAGLFVVSVVSFGFFSGASNQNRYPPIPSSWTGSNANLKYYSLYPGYPKYDPHPRYLGELSGSWREIGEQYGKRAGDLIRMVFEGWFFEVVQVQGSAEAVRQY